MILREHNEKNNIFQILLKVWAFALILFHTLLAAFRYIISYERFGKILQWAGLGMAAVFVLFIIVMICISKTVILRKKSIPTRDSACLTSGIC